MPEQFGLIGMVTALTGFAQMFKDLGLSNATIQRKDITHEQVSTLFWINVCIGTLIMLIVAAMSPVIGWFYSDMRLKGITLAISCSFFFGGLTIQHQALLYRQMRFGHLAWVKILSIALSIPLSIALAWYGFEYWALVWKEVATTAFIAAGTWLMCRWRPSLPARGSEIGSMLRFGRDITGFNIINYFSRNLDKILIGRIWGATPLGFYTKAYQLMLVPMDQIRFPLTRVGVSALSALQDDTDKYRQYYKKLISILSFVLMPAVIYVGIFSENFIRLLLGEKWIEAAVIFRILAITAFIQPIASTPGLVMITCGKTKRYFLWGIINTVCMIPAFSIGVQWGPIGVATAYAIANYAILLPSLWFGFKDTPIKIRTFFQAISLPAISSLFMGLVLIVISKKMTILGDLGQIVIFLPVGMVVYFGASCLFPGGKKELMEILSYSMVALKRSN